MGGAGFNGGSGGGIRLVAAAVQGTGLVDVSGDRGCAGRIRIDTIDRTQIPTRHNPGSPLEYNVGAFMTVFPPNNPHLDITQITAPSGKVDAVIPEGTDSPVILNLPFGADPNRTVTVQARNFKTVLPIEVVLTPDAGPSLTVKAQLDAIQANPATVTVPVTFPINTPVAVNAWIR